MAENVNIEELEDGTVVNINVPGYWGECSVHVMKEGETLADVAKNNQTTVNTLKKMNGIEDENADICGKKIFVPYW